MYGLWILFIIFGFVSIVCFTLAIASHKLFYYYEGKLEYVYEYNGYDDQVYRDTAKFYDTYSDRERLDESECKRLRKILRKREFWSALDDGEEPFYVVGVLTAIIAVILLLCAIFVPISAQHEVLYWQNFVQMVETTIGNTSNEYQTFGIASDIIEYNTWLTNAQTSQQVWKNWSCYYGIDLSNLKYIQIGQ